MGMGINFSAKLALTKRIIGQKPVKISLAIWAVICAYDTALSQIIPESIAQRFPKVREVIAMTSGFLPFWGWLLILAAIIVVASLEYAYRQTKAANSKAATNIRFGDEATAIVVPAPKYNRAQIGRIVEAIDEFYPILLEADNALVFGSEIAASMEAIIRANGADVYLSYMDDLRLKLNDALGRLQTAKERYGLYQEACRIVAESNLYSDPLYASLNDFAGILREIPGKLTASSLAIFVSAKKETFITRVAQFHEWTKQQKQALVMYRQFYLQHPATD